VGDVPRTFSLTEIVGASTDDVARLSTFGACYLTHTKEHFPMDWRDKAACLTADPELFFPVGNTGPAVDQIEKAKAVCGRCSVTETCLQYALETNQDSGVWGGLSEDERRALKRRAARARRAS
jgi:WhiB family redox-sensing transcriptional regulator